MKTIITLLAIFALSGCATSGDYKEYVTAQSEANRQATEAQKPLVRITAQPGQAITGLSSLEVYMPVAAQQVQQARPNEWVGLLGQGISVLGAVAGLKVSGDAAIGLADSVGKYTTQGYNAIQNPQANVSTVTTNTTTDASNRSTTDASNRSTTTGATSSIVGSYNPSDSSTHSTPTITGSYNPSTSATTTTGSNNPSTTTTTTTTIPTPVPEVVK